MTDKQLPGKVYALSIHADYQCRHSGACCTADWDVPVELPVYRSLSEAHEAGRLVVAPASSGLVPFVTGPDLPDDAAAMLERNAKGECVFFDRDSHLCVVHRDLGEPALASTCRHFPRLAVHDRRGTFVSLSHYCPTAASMLFRDDVPLTIVEGPAAFPPANYEGLDVTDEDLPPLLRPDVLMDDAGYSAWERHMIAVCAAAADAESALATLARDARQLRAWTGGGDPLVDAVGRLPLDPETAPAAPALSASLAAFAEAMRAVPDDLRPSPDEDGLGLVYRERVQPQWSAFAAPLTRYVAAKAFASWTAYQGRGVATIVRGLEAALALVRVEAARQCRDAARPLDADLLKEAIRQADFILNHLATGDALAEAWARAETEEE